MWTDSSPCSTLEHPKIMRQRASHLPREKGHNLVAVRE